jgi:hypothetical protein
MWSEPLPGVSLSYEMPSVFIRQQRPVLTNNELSQPNMPVGSGMSVRKTYCIFVESGFLDAFI